MCNELRAQTAERRHPARSASILSLLLILLVGAPGCSKPEAPGPGYYTGPLKARASRIPGDGPPASAVAKQVGKGQ